MMSPREGERKERDIGFGGKREKFFLKLAEPPLLRIKKKQEKKKVKCET